MALQLTTTVQESADGSFNPDRRNGGEPSGLVGSDDFESYVNDQTLTGEVNGGMTWTGGRKTTNLFANGGTLSMDMGYTGNPDLASQASNEMRFELDQLYTELTIEFDLYIPTNYEHRDGSSSGLDNNKFLRLWADTYSGDYEKIGFSTIRQASTDSAMGSDKCGSTATNGSISTAVSTSADFIMPEDHGTWMSIKIEVSAPKSASEGFEKIYKNDVLLINENLLVNVNQTGDQPGYRYGYFLGYANSGFTEDTELCIDNVVITEGVS